MLVWDGPAGLERHLNALSREYGCPVFYNEAVFRATPQRRLAQRDLSAAIGLARPYARHYQTSFVAP